MLKTMNPTRLGDLRTVRGPRPSVTPPCERARAILAAAACCWLALTIPLALLDPRVVQPFASALQL